MTKAAIFILILTILIATADASDKKRCTQKEAMQALTEANTHKDWDSAYKSFKRFGHCDTGAISEGYSETVGRLLADDWKHFNRLAELCTADTKFKGFVTKHINATIPVDVLQNIIDNTRLHCPSEAIALCKAIEDAASSGWEPEKK